MKRKERAGLLGRVCWLVLAVSAAQASSEDDLQRFLSEYRSLTHEQLLDPAIGRPWSDRLLRMAEDPTIAWSDRAYMFRQAAHGYDILRDKEAQSRTMERFYEGALKNDDKTAQLSALDYFAGAEGEPGNREEIERKIAYHENRMSILADPPSGQERRFREKLALEYFRLGRFLMEAAQKTENLDPSVKQELLKKSIDNLQTYIDLGIFKYESEWSALYNLADACAAAGRTKRAVELYKKVAAMPDSRVPPSQAMLNAICLEYPDKMARIGPMEEYLASAERDKTTDTFKQDLGFIYLDVEQWDKAIAIFTQLSEGDKDDDIKAYDMFLAATALRRSGRPDEAHELLKTIMARFPSSPTAQELVDSEKRQVEFQINQIQGDADSIVNDMDSIALNSEVAGENKEVTAAAIPAPDRPTPTTVEARQEISAKSTIPMVVFLTVIGLCGVWLAFRKAKNRRCRAE